MTTTPQPTSDDDWIAVGKIMSPWGIKGWFKVQAYSEHADALFHCDTWQLRKSAGLRARNAEAVSIDIEQIKDHAKGIVAKAYDVSDRNAAEAWKNWEVYLPRSAFPETEDNEYYWVDLMGLSVVNRQGESLGVVDHLIETGAHDVLVLRSEHTENAKADATVKDDEACMIPFVDAYVDQVDKENRTITVDWQLDY